MIYFIVGGARSGKSRYAQQLAMKLSKHPIYMATARPWDAEFKERIARHQADREACWTTIEEDKNIGSHTLNNQTIVLDCITLWLTNIFTDENYNASATLKIAKSEFRKFVHNNNHYIIVSNEIGMGGHAQTKMGRDFSDIQGWINQFIAAESNEVIQMIVGIPQPIKSTS